MKTHLINIINDLKLLLETSGYKYDKSEINLIQEIIEQLINDLNNDLTILQFDFEKIKRLSNMVYDLNYNNDFCSLTDHISNELYSFEFLLEEKLKETKKGSD